MDEVEDLTKVSFVLPPDALQRPPSAAQRSARPTLDRRIAPFQQSPDQALAPAPDDPFAASAAADRAALAGTGLEDLLVPSPAGNKDLIEDFVALCTIGTAAVTLIALFHICLPALGHQVYTSCSCQKTIYANGVIDLGAS